MPGVIFHDTLSGVGSADLSGNVVFYVAWQVTTEGPHLRRSREGDTEHLANVGYVAFGNDVTSAGILSGDAWHPEIWLNWVQGQTIPVAARVGSDFGMDLAARIHWSIGVGTEVDLYVFGDTA